MKESKLTGLKLTPQRLAILQYLRGNRDHPSAADIYAAVSEKFPTMSFATVYNTLNLLVGKGVLKPQIIKEGKIVYDPSAEKHHHFVDEKTGEICDIPWEAIRVTGEDALEDFEVLEYQVILRGNRRRR